MYADSDVPDMLRQMHLLLAHSTLTNYCRLPIA
jgi:hypothetical protein